MKSTKIFMKTLFNNQTQSEMFFWSRSSIKDVWQPRSTSNGHWSCSFLNMARILPFMDTISCRSRSRIRSRSRSRSRSRNRSRSRSCNILIAQQWASPPGHDLSWLTQPCDHSLRQAWFYSHQVTEISSRDGIIYHISLKCQRKIIIPFITMIYWVLTLVISPEGQEVFSSTLAGQL